MSVPFLPGGQIASVGRFSHRTTVALPFPPVAAPYRRRHDRAVVTWVAGESAYRWFSVTGPAMHRYAGRVGADLVVLEGFGGQPYALLNKFRVRQVFDEYGYDEVLFVDADVLLRDGCTDLFAVVPAGHAGILDEGRYQDEWARAAYLREAAALLLSQDVAVDVANLPTPKNSGLYLLRREHRHVLTVPERPFPLCGRDGATVEQTWMALMLARHDVPLYALEHPVQHWLWYLDPEERETGAAAALHFAGLTEPERRYRRLAHHAEVLARAPASGPHPAPACVGSRGPAAANPDGSDGWATTGQPGARIPHLETQLMLDTAAPPALRLCGLSGIDSHRHGWKVATAALSVLHDPAGIPCDTFVEDTFLWHGEQRRLEGAIPYRRPWLGFVHNPPGVPDWRSIGDSRLQRLSRDALWQESLRSCQGLFALTEYLAAWVRREWQVPCEAVTYPTLIPDAIFSMDRLLDGGRPLVAMIGFWLRRFSSFGRLRAPGYSKIRPDLLPAANLAGRWRIAAYEREEAAACLDVDGTSPAGSAVLLDGDVRRVPRLTAHDYDDLLSRCVVFLDLIDASGVTVLVECLARGTPLLVNPLPPVVEYLGPDYPLYFSSLEDAGAKLGDLDAVAAAHEHMLANPVRRRLAPQAFLDAFVATAGFARARRLFDVDGWASEVPPDQ